MRSWRRPVLAVALAIVLLSALVYLLWTYLHPSTASDRKDFIDLMTKIIGGAALLTGLFFTWRNLKITQDTAMNNLRISQETLKITGEGKLTERFAKAIEQLASEKVEIRLGGIYSLERIARESKTDHWPIMEILSAYLREKRALTKEVSDQALSSASEVKAICKIITRRRTEYEEDGQYIDLHETYLAGEDFSDSNLKRANVSACNLESANLAGANLEDADLSSANLRNADCRRAVLRRANLIKADMSLAKLSEADLQEAGLDLANLKGADLDLANLELASFSHADLDFATLRYANARKAGFQQASLYDAKLYKANLEGANLTDAKLVCTQLVEAKLSGVRLRNAELYDADLSETDLKGVDLRTVVGLTLEQVRAASFFEDTLLPGYLDSDAEQDPPSAKP